MHHETKTAKPGVSKILCAIVSCFYIYTIYYQQTEPVYSYVLPHCDPLKCPVGALAILLYCIFDQEKIIQQVAEWNWEDPSSWGQVLSF